MWPTDEESLVARQRELAATPAEPWTPPDEGLRTGGCWVCFARGQAGPGSAGDPAWTASVAMREGRVLEQHVIRGAAGAAYVPGLLALRLGALMEQAVRALAGRPDVLLVDATGRDHPHRAGLALHLGAELAMPTVGVTHRPLRAEGPWPADRRGATSPLRLGDEVVACWLRTRPGVRPLVVHPGWRVDLHTAVALVSGAARRRTPEPLRRARQAAREARSRADVR
ncbi:endonuclease V [Nocardioides koreensis]|uniref:Endonuclease V n=1 Tax=Nocardioides koreensis TaxID=433651 RepID=A0ABN3A437_9ACTN